MSSGSTAGVNNAGTLGRGSSTVNVNGNTTSGGYNINIIGSTITVTNPCGQQEIKEWGDPHETINGKTADWTEASCPRPRCASYE